MLRRRLPLIVGSLVILGLIGFVTLYRSSPGDLARPHAAVAGSPLITDCNKCHAKDGLKAGCQACHTEIEHQLSRHSGYHNYLAQQKKTDCAKCHSDHNGAEFVLVNKVSWEGREPSTFTHPHVTYKLKGAHTALRCVKCHTGKGRAVFVLPKYPKFPRKDSYLGLSQACMSCHADPHAAGRAWNCTACHDQKHWKPAPFFNHDKYYPLRGPHLNLKCGQCHSTPRHGMPANDPLKRLFGPTKGKRCADCHENPHRSRWVESCEACHKIADLKWNIADPRMTKDQHAVTGFRLIVPHQKTSCRQCHRPDLPFKLKYPDPRSAGYKRFEKNCEACHQDAHRGQFVSRHPHCMDCHSRSAFMPPRYGIQDHVTYPLIGGHLKAACNACHVKDPHTHIRQYVPTPKECSVCHKDIHYGQFRKENGKTHCEDCHQSTTSWSKLVFNHNIQSRYKLDKTHIHVACAKCHPSVTARGIHLIQYKPLGMKCRDCHAFDK